MVRKIGYILLAVLLASCEVIREEDRLIETPVQISKERAHVLIEYTGFRCVSCPTAAAHAALLKETYGDQLIIVAMHPATNPFTQGAAQYNYTCPEADIYYRYMGGTASTSFPVGNINMVATESGYLTDYLQWAGQISRAMQEPCKVHLTALSTWIAENKQVEITTTAYSEETSKYQLILWLIEDNIEGAQAMPDGSVNTAYLHQHVLRGTGKEVWGSEWQITPTPSQQTQSIHIPDQCIPENCHVIVILIDSITKQIVNATQTTINTQ